MFVKFWKIYGVEGHRQRQSFGKSSVIHVCTGEKLIVLREDVTKTNDYVLLGIGLETPDHDRAEDALWAQICDGIFEDSRVGKIEEYTADFHEYFKIDW